MGNSELFFVRKIRTFGGGDGGVGVGVGVVLVLVLVLVQSSCSSSGFKAAVTGSCSLGGGQRMEDGTAVAPWWPAIRTDARARKPVCVCA